MTDSGSEGVARVAETIRVLVADDQAIVRDGLVTVLDLLPDIEVVGEAANGEEACRMVAETAPDVVLMDLRMPVLDGAAATARIVAEHPDTAVLVLTTYADDASVMGALRAGARGYLTKDASRAEVAAAVRSVARGQTTFARDVGARLIGGLIGADEGRGDAGSSSAAAGAGAGAGAGASADAAQPAIDAGFVPPSPAELRVRHPQLTAREAEVLALVADGRSNAEIATSLYVSVATVKTHINAVFAKLQVRDRAQAIALARS
ncbi:response regulator transcription factor [Planctomonas sp. JC2975]|uniref:response regulator transcription factor n=1 Tax=Planctomonas sp. JC2975 TaxID=2729626 RepID=UPI001472ACDA|nr:response regulator transcription factor [Planctomonas sp. JC2975]NNC11925.1 response regulator transcription factor [Planctomonas sp. JC2975]